MPFSLTPALRAAAGRYCASCSDADAEVLQKYSRDGTSEISLEHVQLLSRSLRRLPGPADGPVWVRLAPAPPHAIAVSTFFRPTPQVCELLQGAAPVISVFTKAERAPHPELAGRLEVLKAAEENREYASMVGDVCCEEGDGRDAAEMNTYRSQVDTYIFCMYTVCIVEHTTQLSRTPGKQLTHR